MPTVNVMTVTNIFLIKMIRIFCMAEDFGLVDAKNFVEAFLTTIGYSKQTAYEFTEGTWMKFFYALRALQMHKIEVKDGRLCQVKAVTLTEEDMSWDLLNN